MRSHADMSFAELMARGVPLSAAEACALVRRVAEQCETCPDATEIFLGSGGQVTFDAAPVASRREGTVELATLLHRLLGLDRERAELAGVPGGLLVILARMLGQIDLPPLSAVAFRETIVRFAAGVDEAALAEVFWRAAKRRPGLATRLTGWRVAAGAAAIVIAAVVIGVVGGLSPRAPGAPAASPTAAVSNAVNGRSARLQPGPAAPSATVAVQPDAERARRQRPRRRAAAAVAEQPARIGEAAPRRVRTVDMVNLPRSTWAVTRER